MPINVSTSVYEGPLELLLELIEKRKLLINDISLASVTDEYIARINAMGELPVGETAQFVSLAATLLLIKSRSLLPLLNISEEESRDIKELEYRLALYQLIQEAARGLTLVLKESPPLWEGEPPAEVPRFTPDESATIASLLEATRTLIDGFPKTLTLPNVAVKKILSIEEVIDRLSQRVSTAMRLSFKEFSNTTSAEGTAVKHDIIVSFLALLELVKQGIIKATQEDSGDITLESDVVSTPSYE